MSDVFEYRPKFVDIRVKKPDAAEQARAPKDRPCDHVGCTRAGGHPAPKGRDHGGEFWHFCREHVADYNKRWNYFSGMSDADLAAYQAQEEIGHRPTWAFRGSKDRLAAAIARGRKPAGDAFNLFNHDGDPAKGPKAAPKRRLTRLQTLALDAMSLGEGATGPEIRARYAELVKRWHPDSNRGDRGAETQLQKVIYAYQTLKQAGLV